MAPFELGNAVLNYKNGLFFRIESKYGKKCLLNQQLGCNFTEVPFIEIKRDKLCISWNNYISLTITHIKLEDNDRYDIEYHIKSMGIAEVIDQISLKDAHWYACSQLRQQKWPLEMWSKELCPFVAADVICGNFGSVQEKYWLSSKGVAIYSNKDMPLFVSINSKWDKMLTFVSKWASPYKNVKNESVKLSYSIIQADNVLQAHLLTMNQFISKPIKLPNEDVFRFPIWSTYGKYTKNLTQESVLAFMKEIKENNFDISLIEIHDSWNTTYGDLEFDFNRFPNPKLMINNIKKEEVKIKLWFNPFGSYFSLAVKERKDFWIKSGSFPGYVSWKNGLAKVLDLSNSGVVSWFKAKLQNFKIEYDIDCFKLDAGEVNWLPPYFRTLDPMSNPNEFSKRYAQIAYEIDKDNGCQDSLIGLGTQNQSIFIQMSNKTSIWGLDNGLKSVIPQALTLGLLGYPFFFPGIIGGVLLNSSKYPEEELYIRWIQVCTLLPTMQFSYSPWDYGRDAVVMARKMLALREKYISTLIELAENSVETGEPIIRPIWWIAPNDEVALTVDNEFLVGNEILVAPVLDKGVLKRNIYFPKGNWRDIRNDKIIDGEKWVLDYRVEIDELPVFESTTYLENEIVKDSDYEDGGDLGSYEDILLNGDLSPEKTVILSENFDDFDDGDLGSSGYENTTYSMRNQNLHENDKTYDFHQDTVSENPDDIPPPIPASLPPDLENEYELESVINDYDEAKNPFNDD